MYNNKKEREYYERLLMMVILLPNMDDKESKGLVCFK